MHQIQNASATFIKIPEKHATKCWHVSDLGLTYYATASTYTLCDSYAAIALVDGHICPFGVNPFSPL